MGMVGMMGHWSLPSVLHALKIINRVLSQSDCFFACKADSSFSFLHLVLPTRFRSGVKGQTNQ
jgi:hypothetical protein